MTSPTTTSPAVETAPRGRRVYTQQEKADYLALFEKSEMTQADFCQEMGLNESTFSVWVRAARGETNVTKTNIVAPQFAEVRLSAPTTTETTPAAVTVQLPSGMKIEVNAATDAVWQGLGLLLKTLPS